MCKGYSKVVVISVLLMSLPVAATKANVTGFSSAGQNGEEWTLNSNTADTPSIINGVLTLTTPAADEAVSAWYNTKQDVASPWIASFDWNIVPNSSAGYGAGVADGFYFAMQDAGLSAIGGNGNDRGYVGGNVVDSAAVGPETFVNYSSSFSPYYSLPLVTLGEDGAYSSTNYEYITSISFTPSTIPYSVVVAYNGNGSLSFSVNQGLNEFSHTYTGVDISAFTSNSNAFIGITGGTGAGWSEQQFSNFSFTSIGNTVSTPPTDDIVMVGCCSAFLWAAGHRRSRLTKPL